MDETAAQFNSQITEVFGNLIAMETAPANLQQNTDGEHLRLLSIFHYVVGGLAALFACIPLVHLAMGVFMIIAPGKFGPSSNQPPAFFGSYVRQLWLP